MGSRTGMINRTYRGKNFCRNSCHGRHSIPFTSYGRSAVVMQIPFELLYSPKKLFMLVSNDVYTMPPDQSMPERINTSCPEVMTFVTADAKVMLLSVLMTILTYSAVFNSPKMSLMAIHTVAMRI